MAAVSSNAPSASSASPARWLAVPSSRNTSARLAGLLIPSSSAVRSRIAASSNVTAAAAARAASTLYSMPRCASSKGAAAAK